MLVKAREKFWTPQNIAPYYKVAGGGGGPHIPLALDLTSGGGTGTITANNATGTVTTGTFTTGAVNEIILVSITTNASTPSGNGAVTGVTATGLTFARIPGLTAPFVGATTLDMWWALSAGIFSNPVTATFNTAIFSTVNLFAVVGADLVTPFDPFGPVTSTSATAATVSSTGTNVFGVATVVNGGLTPPPQNGFSILSTANFNCICTKIQTASAFSSTVWPNATDNGSLAGASLSFCLKGS